MKSIRFWVALFTLALFTAAPAMAVVVAYENFEDDMARPYNPDPLIFYPGLDGPPTNDGLPGKWHPNQFLVSDPWHDPLDSNPDTNWQLQVVKDLFPGTGNEAFFQNQHNGLDPSNPCHDFWQCSRSGDVDCPGVGGQPAPCNNDRFSRDGFLQFATWDPNANGGQGAHVPRPAVLGDTLGIAFDVRVYEGFPVFALTNDIEKMVAETGDTEIHPPMTKWSVGFGQTFHAVPAGLARSDCSGSDPSHDNVVSVLSYQTHNGHFFDTWAPGCNRFELDPDLNLAHPDDDFVAFPTRVAPVEYMNHLELTLTLTDGVQFFDKVMLTYMKPDGTIVTEEVTQQEPKNSDVSSRPQDSCGGDPRCGGGNLVPLTRAEILDSMLESVGLAQIDGLIFSDEGNGQGADEYRIDNICIVINGELDECDAVGGGPLEGDANKDGLVTGADLISVQQNFGQTGTPPLPGDANNDGLVTGADLISVQQNFGNVLAAPVPEPATIALLVCCLSLIRRRSSCL